MKSNIKNQFSKMGSMSAMEQFFDILELPDEQFDAVYPELKDKIIDAFDQPQVKNEVAKSLELTPIQDLEQEMVGLDAFITEIESDDELSANKKDFLVSMMRKSGELIKAMFKNPRQVINVKIQKIHEDAVLPKYAHELDAGADIFAIEDTIIKPYETKVIPTGIKMAVPAGYEVQIRPRSGLSLKSNIRVANAPGTIDAEYRGEVGVIITNTNAPSYTIKKGDKIAQMVIAPTPMIKWEEVDELDDTERGEGGYGSTDQE